MPEYVDIYQKLSRRPAETPAEWRISCYAIAIRDGQILMTEPVFQRRWELPGGGVQIEREETLIETAIRECREETGYRFRPDPATLHFSGEYFFRAPSGRHYHSLTFVVEGDVDDEPDPEWSRDPEEIVRVGWLDPASLSAADVQWFHRDALQQVGIVV